MQAAAARATKRADTRAENFILSDDLMEELNESVFDARALCLWKFEMEDEDEWRTETVQT